MRTATPTKNKLFVTSKSFLRLKLVFGIVTVVALLALISFLYISKDKGINTIRLLQKQSQAPDSLGTRSSHSGLVPFVSPSQVVDDHEQWNTYINEKVGISFQYPNNWEVRELASDESQELTNIMELTSSSIPVVWLSYLDNPSNLPLEELDQTIRLSDDVRGLYSPNLSSLTNQSVIAASGITAYYQDDYFCDPSICQRYVLPNNNKVIQLVIFPQQIQIPDLNESVDHILSTFTFTN